MMLFKVLVISVLCALAVAFPTEATTDDPLDLLSEELLNLPANIEDLLDSITNIIKTVRKLPPPIEKVIKIQKADTDSDPTMDFNPTSDFLSPTEGYHKNTQIAVSSPEAETVPSSFLEEDSETSDPNLTFSGTLDPPTQ
ncbi:kidney androgen-regulated protein-like [Alexandromys fortis]|uniref:kidney androgen-regulated protein-like n=1 Tax=Alexandromys fortis TaxID=100897 RepID=UPI002153A61D|nr:kidney androgen-regulated protein-like [Microtus fortis]